MERLAGGAVADTVVVYEDHVDALSGIVLLRLNEQYPPDWELSELAERHAVLLGEDPVEFLLVGLVRAPGELDKGHDLVEVNGLQTGKVRLRSVLVEDGEAERCVDADGGFERAEEDVPR